MDYSKKAFNYTENQDDKIIRGIQLCQNYFDIGENVKLMEVLDVIVESEPKFEYILIPYFDYPK